MPGMGHSAAWWKQYEAIRAKGASKASAARITNSEKSKKKPKPRKKAKHG